MKLGLGLSSIMHGWEIRVRVLDEDVMLRIWCDGGVDGSRQKLTVDVINVTNDKINDLS